MNEHPPDDQASKENGASPKGPNGGQAFPFWEEAEKSAASSLGWNAKIGLWPVLVVVLALGLLNMFFPAVTSVLNNPERAEALNDVTQYATAMKAYVTEYGEYPAGGAARILKALRGDNPRKLIFLEIDDKKMNAQGFWIDSWGTPYLLGVKDWKPWAYSWGKNKVDEGGNGDDTSSWSLAP